MLNRKKIENKSGKRKFKMIFLITNLTYLIFILLFSGLAHAERLPTVNSDSGSWGTTLNNYLLFEHTTNGSHRNVTVEGSFKVISLNNNISFFINSTDGNVGINTSKPAQTLTVQGTLNVTANTSSGVNLFVASSGSVGIGTATPSNKLEVFGGGVKVNNTGLSQLGADAGRSLELHGSSDNPYIDMANAIATDFDWRFIGATGASPSLTIQSASTNPVMTFLAGGSVGINTTTPAQILTVQGTLNVTANTSAGANLFVAPTGYVGVGTSSPISKLHVASGNISVSPTTSDATQIQLLDTSGNFVGGFRQASSGNLGGMTIMGYRLIGSNNGFGIEFDARSNDIPIYLSGYNESGANVSVNKSILRVANNFNDVFSILGSGNVGINTTYPAQTLTVQGTLNVTPAGQGDSPSLFVTSTGNVGIGTSTPVVKLHLYINGTNLPDIYFSDNDSGSTQSDGFGIGGDVNEDGYLWNFENQSIYFGTNNTERVRILAGGSLGINTTTPAQTLTVQGTLNATPAGASNISLFVDSKGNVGIGTSNPKTHFNVKQNATIEGNLTVGSPISPTNITMYSPNGALWHCAVDNSGTFSCS